MTLGRLSLSVKSRHAAVHRRSQTRRPSGRQYRPSRDATYRASDRWNHWIGISPEESPPRREMAHFRAESQRSGSRTLRDLKPTRPRAGSIAEIFATPAIDRVQLDRTEATRTTKMDRMQRPGPTVTRPHLPREFLQRHVCYQNGWYQCTVIAHR
jgi:hypothetical protein